MRSLPQPIEISSNVKEGPTGMLSEPAFTFYTFIDAKAGRQHNVPVLACICTSTSQLGSLAD